MTREELERILNSTRRKHAKHWYILGAGEWEQEWRDGRSVWEQGCVGVIFPPGIERWNPALDDGGQPYTNNEVSGIDEWYVFNHSTVKDVKDGIAHLNSEYKSYLDDGWVPMWQNDEETANRQSTPTIKVYTGE